MNLLGELRIGSLRLDFPVVQAALSGYSDMPMRVLARRFGAPYTLCEVMLDKFIVEVKPRRRNRHFFHVAAEEHPTGGQLMGADPLDFAPAALRLVEHGFDVIDINFGCPVKKVVKRNGGSGCLRDLDLVQRVIRAVIGGTHLPVTVKIRSGWSDDLRDPVGIALRCQDAGARALALHPRTRTQMFTGAARWDEIAAVVDALEIPVIGNGDIRTQLLEEQCEIVRVGRLEEKLGGASDAKPGKGCKRRIRHRPAAHTGQMIDPAEE